MASMLTLISMVKNEGPRIGRMIRSVVGLCDEIIILDTGSTDNTKSEALAVSAYLGLKCTVHEREWVNFGVGRTQLYELASGQDGWLLLLDADMTARFSHEFPAWLQEACEADILNVQLTQPGLSWRLPLITRATDCNGRPWEYVGAMHESLVRNGLMIDLFASDLTVVHHGDNGYDTKLAERLAILEAQLDGRSIYYAAQTLRDMGRTEDAARRYWEAAGVEDIDPNHRWHALYQHACLTRNVDMLYEAWQLRPWRSEPLQAMAAIGKSYPIPTDLFVEPSAYDGVV